MLPETTNQMSDNKYTYINLDYMEMMSDGDVEMKKVMLDMLLEELPMELDKMKSLLDQQNWDELGSVSHKMKSTLAFVGNDEMTNANKDIELIAKSGEEVNTIAPLVNALKDLCPKVVQELNLEKDRL